ncbi:hypothetical protein [Sphingomicrobium nitratireducens]|uniref:hypothetical protein n=1 Tax=Sphingomicrobium nitratireducens TaxID=2964666 RepID=UPI0022401634|nr:hypothetical protein [Sphingomicrobium nitratireducens]
MQFLKTLFWVLLAVVIAIFATANWHDVMVDLWGDLRMAIKLPLLLAITFALGFVPTLLYYRTKVWSLNKRIGLTERNLAQSPLTPPPPTVQRRTPTPQSSSPFEAE